MPRPDFAELRNELLRSGIAARHVRRTVAELGDHYDDLVAGALAEGAGHSAAEEQARRRLGALQDIAVAVRAQPELRSWALRFPRLALIAYPLACIAILPAVPIMAGFAYAGHLARWAACILLGGLVTAAIFLTLQLSIALT